MLGLNYHKLRLLWYPLNKYHDIGRFAICLPQLNILNWIHYL